MKPQIGITMGDPAGIGPELIVKLLQNKNYYMYSIKRLNENQQRSTIKPIVMIDIR